MVTPEGERLEGRVDGSGPYPVGSGDAFLAGLVVALDSGAGWPEPFARRSQRARPMRSSRAPGAWTGSRAAELAEAAAVASAA